MELDRGYTYGKFRENLPNHGIRVGLIFHRNSTSHYRV